MTDRISIMTLAAAQSAIEEAMAGGGIIAGKNMVIKSIEPIAGGNRITFGYTLDDGTEMTQTLDVMDGKDGKDGVDGISPEVQINNGADG